METTEVNTSKLCEAVAYGDAAGLPVETKSNAEISIQYGKIDRLLAAKSNPFFIGEYQPGTWSDDTQLTLAVADGLISAQGFEIDAQAETHVRALQETPIVDWEGKMVPRGWGGSTTRSIRRIQEGVPPLQAGETDEFDSESGKGNAVIMKLGPLAAWATYQTEGGEIYQDVEQLTLMTHNTETAVACSQVHMDILRALALADPKSDPIITLQEELEHSLGRHRTEYPEAINSLIQQLGFVRNALSPLTPAEILEKTDGKGFYVPQTLAMVYGAFMIENKFPESVYTAVNLGGDTDSTASIIAVMSLFLHKDIEFPEDVELLDQRDRLQNTSRELAKLVGERG